MHSCKHSFLYFCHFSQSLNNVVSLKIHEPVLSDNFCRQLFNDHYRYILMSLYHVKVVFIQAIVHL
jgi:hypothetical protein